MTPPQYAKTLGIHVDKVLAWIHSGELRAINIALDANGERPRWRIPLEEIERFQQARANKPAAPKPAKRRRRRAVATGKQWF